MKDNPLHEPLAALGQIFGAFVGAFEQERRETLRSSSATLRQQANLLSQEAERLEKRLGSDHPDVLEITAAAEGARMLVAHDRQALQRAEQWPRVDEDGWMIVVRVRRPAGEPAARVRVRFVDAQNQLAKALGTATTNDDGELYRLYSPIQDRDVLELRPEVYVEVVDGRGQVRLRSEQAAKVTPGAAAYFDLRLTANGRRAQAR